VPVILNRLATDLRVLIDLAFLCILCDPSLGKRAEKVVSRGVLFKPFLKYFIYCGWSALGQAATTSHPIFANMNKTTLFTAVILTFGLFAAQAADKVLFEDSSLSKEGWSEFAEIPGTGGWEVKRRELGDLAQAVVQEVTLEGSGGIFLSAGEGSYMPLCSARKT
jgi:hypothetical protein